MQKRFDLRSVWAALALVLMAGAVPASENQSGPSADGQDVLLVATLLNSSEGRMPGAPDYGWYG